MAFVPPERTVRMRWFQVCGVADLRRGIAQNQFMQAFGGMYGEPHAGHAADGESAEMYALEFQGVEQTDHVATPAVRWNNRAGSRRFRRARANRSAARGNVFRRYGDLRIPRFQIGAQRI